MSKLSMPGMILGGALALGGVALLNLDPAEAQKKTVTLVAVDPSTLAADFLELRRLPDAGVQVLCRGTVAVTGGGYAPLEAAVFEANRKQAEVFDSAMAECEDPLKIKNPRLK